MKSDVRKQVRERIAALLTTASGLVAALAWNGAIRAIFAKVFGDRDTIVAVLIYAIVVTVVSVIVTIVVARSVAKEGG